MMVVLAIAGFVVFVWRELKAEKPMVDLRLFRVPQFAVGTVLVFLTSLLIYGIGLLTPQFLQLLMAYPSLAAGMATAPLGLGAVISMVMVGALVRRIDARAILMFGFMVFALAAFLLSRVSLEISPWTVFWPQVLAGSAMGFLFVPINVAGTAPLRRDEIGSATGTLNLMRNVGGSVGISWVSTLLARRSQVHQTILCANLTPGDQVLVQDLGGLRRFFSVHVVSFGNATSEAWAALYRILQQQSYLLAFKDVYEELAVVALGAITLLVLLRKPEPGGRRLRGGNRRGYATVNTSRQTNLIVEPMVRLPGQV
jgi:DHA2 family multidrug resistance protein